MAASCKLIQVTNGLMKSFIEHIKEAEEENDYEKNLQFVKDFYATGFPNPMGKGVVFTLADDIGGEEVKAMVMVIMDPKTWGVYISEIHVLEGKGKMGFGSYILGLITKMADEQGITLFLTPKPLDTQGKKIPKAKLVQFYKKNGFVNYQGGMVRKPQGSNNES